MFHFSFAILKLFLNVSAESTFIIGMLYRPPNSSLYDILTSLEFIFDSLPTATTPVYIMRNFNINLLKKKETYVKNLTNSLYSNSFFPTITKPTKVTHSSATLIDQI